MRSAPPVTLNPETGVVRFGDVTVTLPRQRCAVLSAIARRNGERVDYNTLASAGWPHRATVVSLTSIRTVIWKIRGDLTYAGIPIKISSRPGTFGYSCDGVAIESGTNVQLTSNQMEDLRQVLYACPDKPLATRVWSSIGG